MELYSLREARGKLGNIHPSSFYQLVKNGRLRRIVPPGKKNGYYLREEVDKLAQERSAFFAQYITIA